MKLERLGPILVVLAIVLAAEVEASVLLMRSRLHPRSIDECFTCRAEDRPLGYSIMKYFNKMKDALVKGFNAFVDSSKDYKLSFDKLRKQLNI